MTDRIANAHLKLLSLLEQDLLGLAAALPADRYDFRPTDGTFDGVRTFAEQSGTSRP